MWWGLSDTYHLSCLLSYESYAFLAVDVSLTHTCSREKAVKNTVSWFCAGAIAIVTVGTNKKDSRLQTINFTHEVPTHCKQNGMITEYKQNDVRMPFHNQLSKEQMIIEQRWNECFSLMPTVDTGSLNTNKERLRQLKVWGLSLNLLSANFPLTAKLLICMQW